MTDTHNQIIDELSQRLKQARKLNVQHQVQIKDWKVKLENCEIRNVQLEVDIKEVQEELAHLGHELGNEQSRNQEADDEEQRQGQKFLGSEHDNAKGV